MGEPYEGEDRQRGSADDSSEADAARRPAGVTTATDEEEDPDSGPSTGPAHPEDFSPDDFE
ncbi:RNA-protein complex protein Nop10 [Actinoallomurus purpureus]|uniref:RNA-protein complex protein Nop10 n=1 Tax=Actinoallomurus purpureus TaxID=478114 RepID=UPI002092433A|nr:RNA-protein complex protein Nop10 [Actinoallomurus purpureus]MCO6010190.1 RNA-protein complex protein Nop10 [Actinoallomurus purpureus]